MGAQAHMREAIRTKRDNDAHQGDRGPQGGKLLGEDDHRRAGRFHIKQRNVRRQLRPNDLLPSGQHGTLGSQPRVELPSLSYPQMRLTVSPLIARVAGCGLVEEMKHDSEQQQQLPAMEAHR